MAWVDRAVEEAGEAEGEGVGEVIIDIEEGVQAGGVHGVVTINFEKGSCLPDIGRGYFYQGMVLMNEISRLTFLMPMFCVEEISACVWETVDDYPRSPRQINAKDSAPTPKAQAQNCYSSSLLPRCLWTVIQDQRHQPASSSQPIQVELFPDSPHT